MFSLPGASGKQQGSSRVTSQLSVFFMAFKTSVRLRQNTEAFIANLAAGQVQPQSDLLMRVMEDFVDEAIQVYFVQPMEVAQLNPVGRKMVMVAVTTIRKTAQLVLGKVLKKLSNEELVPIAEYMDEVMFRDRCNPEAAGFIAFPLSNELRERFRQIAQRAHTGQPHQVVPDLVEAFSAITDEALKAFFEKPVALLKLGPVLKKMTVLGVDTTRSATNTLLKKLFNTMEPSQLVASIDYFEALMIEGGAQLP